MTTWTILLKSSRTFGVTDTTRVGDDWMTPVHPSHFVLEIMTL